MKFSNACMLIGAAAIVQGCSHAAGQFAPPTQFQPSTLIYGTQVSTGQCVGGVEAAGFLAQLAGAAIAQGVNRIGKAIEEAARTDTQTALARRNLELTAAGLGPCIVVARGWYHRSDPIAGRSGFAFNEQSGFPVTDLAGIGGLWRMGLFLAVTPDFYFQGRLVTNSTNSAYAVLPIHASLDRPIVTHDIRSDDRSVTLSFALAASGASSVQNGATIVLGRLKPGVLSEFPEGTCVISRTGSNQPVLKVCPEQKQEGVSRIIRTAFESEWFSPALVAELKPMTLLAQVTETRDASKFLSFVSALFSDVKAAATTELQHALVPELGADAAEGRTAAKEAAANAYDNAFASATAALAACVTTPADVTKRAAARVAVRNLIAAARKAELATPVNEAHVNAIDPTGTDAGPCQTALNVLRI